MKLHFGLAIVFFMIGLVADSPGVVPIGLSETGHAVVFTLVDSASQELHAAASSLLSGASLDNDTSSGPPGPGVSGPVTVPLPLKSDAAPSKNDSDTSYIVRAEPKRLDSPLLPPSSPSPATAQSSPSSPTEQTQDTVPTEAVAETGQPLVESGIPTMEDVVHEELSNDSSVTVPTDQQAAAHHEEIPSFSEWAQKQLAEAEKKKVENKTGGAVKGWAMKLRSKNYASPDCGAKVVSTNPEASSVWAVLSPSRDEYLLNSCNNKIYFVVELCEAIQPKKIELANFELFSSILREFSVSVSDRHPSRDWTQIGQFEGKEVRTVQSFNVQPPSAFVKYIKVEFHSHYGTEHYCPISLFRVYGTSEFEVLDTVDEAQAVSASLEDDEDEFDEGETLEKPRNLFSSARDAVFSIVKRAAEVLVKREDGTDGTTGDVDGNMTFYGADRHALCMTPAYIIVCDNCTDDHFNRVHQLLSCRNDELESVLESEFIRNTILNSNLCTSRGLDFQSNGLGLRSNMNNGVANPIKPRSTPVPPNGPSLYLEMMLPGETTTALCNLLAISQRRVVLNITYELTSSHDANETVTVGSTDIPVLLDPPHSTCSLDSTVPSSVPYEEPAALSQVSAESPKAANPQIKPTKTLTATEDQHSAPAIAQPNAPANLTDFNQQNDTVIDNMSTATIATQPIKTPNEDQLPTVSESSTVPSEEGILEFPEEGAAIVSDTLTFDSIFSELDEVESDPSAQPATLSPPQVVQRESVFIRLAKRIKALERNMSLSSQYLEELSRRYKRQVEEMQRTLTEVTEERKRVEEKEERRSKESAHLADQVATLSLALEVLIEERNSWAVKHGAVILVEVVIFALVMFVCRWLPLDVDAARHRISVGWHARPQQAGLQQRASATSTSPAVTARRRSIDGSMMQPPYQRSRKRRPSEEALRISGSTHEELMIPEPSRKNSRAENRRRRRKKKEPQVMVATEDTVMVAGTERQYIKIIRTPEHRTGREEYVPPPPPLPPPPSVVVTSVSSSSGSGYVVMPVNGSGGVAADSASSVLPLPPGRPHYSPLQTALSLRKKRNGASRQSSSDSTSRLDSSSTSSTKKAGPLRKIIRKFF